MAYQPLTKEQFQKARTAGFTPDKIIAMEQKRKATESVVSTSTQTTAQPGFVQGVVQDMARPFLRTAATGLGAVGTAIDLGKSLYQKATGQDEAAMNTLNESKRLTDEANTKGYDLGYFGNIKPNQTLAEGFGSGLEMASNIPIVKGAGLTYDVLKGATKQGGIQALKAVAISLAKEGAFAGGTYALGSSVEQGKSVGETALNTALGTVGGAIAGPVLGAGAAVTGNILGKTTNIGRLFKAEEPKLSTLAAQKQVADIADYVRSPLDKVEKAKLKAGYTPSDYKGIFGKKEYALGQEDYAMAQAVKDLVEPGFNKSNQNIERVLQNVNETYNNDLIPFLDDNPVPYTFDEMRNYLGNKVKPSATLKPGSEGYWIFNQIKNKGMGILDNFPKTTRGVQEARTAIDNMINNDFGPAVWDTMNVAHTGAKDAALQLRTALNDFTGDSIRFQDMTTFNKAEDFIKTAQQRGMKFNTVDDVRLELMKYFGKEVLPENELKAILFRNKLKNINLKLKAVNNMWENAQKEIGKTRPENIDNPFIKSAVTIGGSLAAGAALGGLWYKGQANNSN